MRRNSGSRMLPVMMLAPGAAALILRTMLYHTAVDVKGLLVRNHPLAIALTGLTAAVFLLIVLAVRQRKDREDQLSANLPAAVGHVAAGAGILATVFTAAPMMGSYLEIAWRYLGLAAPVCLLLAGAIRLFGKKPFFLLHVVPCLFFLVHIVTRYQLWSANPQLQDYVFALLAAMGLMLFSYYTAAQEADCGNGRMRLGMGLAAIYLCLAELARSSCPALYLGGLVWVLMELIPRRNVETN